MVLSVCFLFRFRLRRIFAETILWSEVTSSEKKDASQFKVLLIHILFLDT